MLAAAHRASSVAVARAASLRFSAYGIVAVGALLLTGAINTWYLAGSTQALTGTNYGHLLVVKIALFLVMLAIAAINRLQLTPRLVEAASTRSTQDALRQLRRNVAIEIAAGVTILAIVGALGVMPPGSEAQAMVQAYPRDSECEKPADVTAKAVHATRVATGRLKARQVRTQAAAGVAPSG
jgi:putative copper export protein